MSNEWKIEEIQYAIDNRLKMSYAEIGKKIGRTRNAVMVKMSKMGYKLPKLYHFDNDFFYRIDTEEKAYWLGFFCADGYVSNDTEIAIHLKASDIEHLKKFNRSLNGNIQIKTFSKTLSATDKTYQMCSIRVYSKKIVDDLFNLGITRKKSLVLDFPKVNKNLLRHFIRGYFDGNGSLYLHKEKNMLKAKFTSGSFIFLQKLSALLNLMNVKTSLTKEKRKNTYNLSVLDKKSTKIFLNYIYEDSSIFLDRKKELYLSNKNLLDYLYDGWNKK